MIKGNAMQPIQLWEGTALDAPETQDITLTPYTLEDGENFSAVLVLPGGGYCQCSNQESGPVAGWLNSIGISAFVLNYHVAPTKHPEPYHDARRALQYIRFHSEKFNIDPNRIGVLGFSAGGHLAATLSNLYDMKNELIDDEIEQVSARPDLSVLCYPVISSGEFAHRGSFETILGSDADPEQLETLSMEKAVHAETPKTFIWHTVEDKIVPVENAYLYAMALSKHNIPHELHAYPYGFHGLGLCSIDGRRNPHAAQWRNACERWLLQEGF